MGSKIETKVFDPQDFADGTELLDATVAHRNGQWFLYLAGQSGGYGATQLFSASLAPGADLSASGWEVTRDHAGNLLELSNHERSAPWDGGGGRHCPSYVKGWDPKQGKWVERLYYAGSAQFYGAPMSLAAWSGMAARGRINLHLSLKRTSRGSMAVSMNRT
jgi:hypothetical protein